MTNHLLPSELVEAAERVIAAHRASGTRIAIAESCTAGLVCAALTEISWSSDVLDVGFVTYSNESKTRTLGVSNDVIETFGAVSIATAWAMAQGALKHSSADIAVAVTGIAGPTGGSELKPIGTVVFARARRNADPHEIVADIKHFGDLGRAGVRLQATLVALELLMPDEAAP